MTDVPRSHPRYESLMTRAKIEDGVKAGLVAMQGLIAHGRGEAPTEPFSDSGAPIAPLRVAPCGPRPRALFERAGRAPAGARPKSARGNSASECPGVAA